MYHPRMRSVAVLGFLAAAELGASPRLAAGSKSLQPDSNESNTILSAPCVGRNRWDDDCPEPRTHEESADRERHLEAARRARQEREVIQARAAAEAARARQEREAFQTRVAAEAARLGPGREDAAERLVTMREAAERAAGIRPAPLPLAKCMSRETSGTAFGADRSEQKARQWMQARVSKRCKLTRSTCSTDKLIPWWVTCSGSWVCPPVEFTCHRTANEPAGSNGDAAEGPGGAIVTSSDAPSAPSTGVPASASPPTVYTSGPTKEPKCHEVPNEGKTGSQDQGRCAADARLEDPRSLPGRLSPRGRGLPGAPPPRLRGRERQVEAPGRPGHLDLRCPLPLRQAQAGLRGRTGRRDPAVARDRSFARRNRLRTAQARDGGEAPRTVECRHDREDPH